MRPGRPRRHRHLILPEADLFRGLRIGLLGGSFNPAHSGHRHLADTALHKLQLDYVWWLVSPQNPLKKTDDMASFDERMASARQRANHPRYVVSDIEQRLQTVYTAQTIAYLRAVLPATRFVWLMGADNLAQIHRWQKWTNIYDSVPVAILGRPTYSLGALSSRAVYRYERYRIKESDAARLAGMEPPAWVFIPGPLHPGSATEIRAQRKKKRHKKLSPDKSGRAPSRRVVEMEETEF